MENMSAVGSGSGHENRIREEEEAAKYVMGGSLLEGLGGALAALMAIAALFFLPGRLAAVAVIVVGIALLVDAGALIARLSRILIEVCAGERDAEEMRGGVTAEFVGGTVAVVLGCWSLTGAEMWTLLSVADIALGLALLLDTGAMVHLNFLVVRRPGQMETPMSTASTLVRAAAGIQMLSGFGATILGILAFAGINAEVLSMVALLVIGCSTALSGASLSWRMARVVYH